MSFGPNERGVTALALLDTLAAARRFGVQEMGRCVACNQERPLALGSKVCEECVDGFARSCEVKGGR